MTITTKKNAKGAKVYYVDGKRVSRDKAIEIAAEQREGDLFTVMAERRFELTDGTVEIRTNEAECKKLKTRIGRYMYERDIEVNGEFIIKVYSDDDARAIVDRITEAYLAGYAGCKINVDGTFTVIESEANPADYAITDAAFREAVTGEVKAAYATKLATEREEIMSTPLTTPEALDAAVEAETELANMKAKNSRKHYSINAPWAECDDPIKFNHVEIRTNPENGELSISSYFECKNLETAYRRFRKIMAQACRENPELEGWDEWEPANKLTVCTGGYENENGDLVLFNSGSGSYCLQVDINEDLFYIYGKFPKAIEVANKDTAVEAETESANAAVETAITISVPASKCDDLGEEALEEIKNELDEITEGKNFCCDVEQGICATVKTSSLQVESIEKLFDSYGLSYQRYVFTANKTEAETKLASVATTEEYLTEQEKWVAEVVARGAAQMAAEETAREEVTFDAGRFGQDSYTVENKAVKIDEDTIEYDANGKIEWVVSEKYGALLQFLPSGEIAYFTKPLKDDGKSFYNELDRWDADDFFLNLAERGACIIGDPKPTDDFASELTELESKEEAARAAVEKAKVALLAAQNMRDEAEAEYRKARKEISRLLNTTASKLTEKIWELPLNAITLKNQDGKSFKAQHGGAVTPHIENTFKISNGWKTCGYYETPAQVTRVIEMLAAALKADKTEFTFPTVDALNQANFIADSLKEVTV